MMLRVFCFIVALLFCLGASAGQELSREDDTLIHNGLRYLAGRQLPDGSWDSARYPHNTGITSLAVLAFMAAGHLPDGDGYGEAVRHGIDYLLAHQQGDGSLLASTSHGPMYEHALSTLLLAESWGMVDAPQLPQALRRAVDRIVSAQNATGGWRYRPESRDADLSVTALQVVALRAAQNAGVPVPQTTIDRASDFLMRCAVPGRGFSYVPGDIPTLGRTAMGALALHMSGNSYVEQVRAAAVQIRRLPFPDRAYPYYAHYYATQLFYQLGGDDWTQWHTQIRDWLKRHQNADGSWHSEIDTTYGTALAVLTLAVPYQYLPIYQRWRPDLPTSSR